MVYRLTQSAADRIDRILADSARIHGVRAAERYARLILVGMSIVGDNPFVIGSVEVRRLSGIRAYPLRLKRMHSPPDDRVRAPRHLIIYRLGVDGAVEILGFAHDRMVLARAAKRATKNAS